MESDEAEDGDEDGPDRLYSVRHRRSSDSQDEDKKTNNLQH